MTAKENWIEIVPVMDSAAPIQVLDELVASFALAPGSRFDDAVASAGTRFRVAFGSAEDRAREFWETLGYVAIWLCGLFGVALCFL